MFSSDKRKWKSKWSKCFSRQINYGSVTIGKKRRIVFSAHDFKTVQKAHDILTEQFVNPPTIEALSWQLKMNSQKLKAGFSYYYHMTIGEYIAALKCHWQLRCYVRRNCP